MIFGKRVTLGLAALAGLGSAAPARAQSAGEPLGRAAWSHMHMLLQKSVFKVDVLTVDICFDAATAARIGGIAARGPLKGAAAQAVTRAALDGRRAFARVEFVRDVSLGQFLDGVGDDLRKARDTGLIADSTYRVISTGLPRWYAFARARGIHKGDQIIYEMEPDAIRTRFLTREGTTPLDDVEPGRARRNSPLASWLAPGSEFRAKLLESLPASPGSAASMARCAAPAR